MGTRFKKNKVIQPVQNVEHCGLIIKDTTAELTNNDC
jgi:hypothetical protein